jgi:hypothetical protein
MSVHSKELNPECLLQLSDEVGRIASTLARISAGAEIGASAQSSGAPAVTPQISAAMVRNVIRERRLRSRFFEEELFADPAWDMMLELLEAELSHRRMAVSSLCVGAAVPATTALRWIKSMVEQGLFVRRADPFDGRRVYVELSSGASQSLRGYFAEIAGLPPPDVAAVSPAS